MQNYTAETLTRYADTVGRVIGVLENEKAGYVSMDAALKRLHEIIAEFQDGQAQRENVAEEKL